MCSYLARARRPAGRAQVLKAIETAGEGTWSIVTSKGGVWCSSDYARDEVYLLNGEPIAMIEVRPAHGRAYGWIFQRERPAKQRVIVGLIGLDRTADEDRRLEDCFIQERDRVCYEWVEQFCDDWGALTIHGLVLPGQMAQSYEGNLEARGVRFKREWVKKVQAQVTETWPDGTFIVFGSKTHLEVVKGLPRIEVLQRVPMRQHAKWMRAQIGECPSGPARFRDHWPAGGGSMPACELG